MGADHNEAYLLAHLKKEHSNLAQSYLEAINVIRWTYGYLDALTQSASPKGAILVDLSQVEAWKTDLKAIVTAVKAHSKETAE